MEANYPGLKLSGYAVVFILSPDFISVRLDTGRDSLCSFFLCQDSNFFYQITRMVAEMSVLRDIYAILGLNLLQVVWKLILAIEKL